MKKKLASLMVAMSLMAILPSCSTLIPKKVEIGQDKVERMPVASATELEKQRRAAAAAEQEAQKTLKAAITVNAPPSVTVPAENTVDLTDALAKSVGPPKDPIRPNEDLHAVANELRTAIAKLDSRLEAFRKENDQNQGKKIEGTGWLQVPYFAWLGGFLVLAFVGILILGVLWTFVKMFAMGNPPVQLGVSAVQLGANFLKKTVNEVVRGGEQFKNRIGDIVTDPALQAKLKEAFRVEHERAQSSDVQELIRQMTGGK